MEKYFHKTENIINLTGDGYDDEDGVSIECPTSETKISAKL